jgi:hypothetical protein
MFSFIRSGANCSDRRLYNPTHTNVESLFRPENLRKLQNRNFAIIFTLTVIASVALQRRCIMKIITVTSGSVPCFPTYDYGYT